MKFSCITLYLRNALEATDRLIEKSASLPILQCVRVTAKKGRVTIAATNLEIGIHASFQAKVDGDGEIAIPGKVLLSYLSCVRDEKISFTVTDNGVVLVESGSQHTTMKTASVADFPIIPSITQGFSVELPSAELLEAFGSLSFLAAPGDVRPELGGVFCSFASQQIRMAATDSFRLGERIMKRQGKDIQGTMQCIIPTRTITEFSRVFSGVASVTIRMNDNQILFSAPDRELVSRLVEGKYPEYEAIIPLSFTTTVHVKNDDLVQVLRAASVFSGKNKEVRAVFSPENKKCILESKNSDVGTYAAEVVCKGEGKELSVACNWQYVLEALGKLNESSVTISGNKETEPLLIKNATEPGTRYLIMPLRSY